MTIPVARIEKFVAEMEARLAPAPDRTKWIRLMVDPWHGETTEFTEN